MKKTDKTLKIPVPGVFVFLDFRPSEDLPRTPKTDFLKSKNVFVPGVICFSDGNSAFWSKNQCSPSKNAI